MGSAGSISTGSWDVCSKEACSLLRSTGEQPRSWGSWGKPTDWLHWLRRLALWLAVDSTLLKLWCGGGHWENCYPSWIIVTILCFTYLIGSRAVYTDRQKILYTSCCSPLACSLYLKCSLPLKDIPYLSIILWDSERDDTESNEI